MGRITHACLLPFGSGERLDASGRDEITDTVGSFWIAQAESTAATPGCRCRLQDLWRLGVALRAVATGAGTRRKSIHGASRTASIVYTVPPPVTRAKGLPCLSTHTQGRAGKPQPRHAVTPPKGLLTRPKAPRSSLCKAWAREPRRQRQHHVTSRGSTAGHRRGQRGYCGWPRRRRSETAGTGLPDCARSPAGGRRSTHPGPSRHH